MVSTRNFLAVFLFSKMGRRKIVYDVILWIMKALYELMEEFND